ncbi:hypothetical protein MKX03_029215, partial [Papaver bracteatum]
VVGFFKTVANIQVLQRSGGKSSRMREIGSAANQVGNDPIDCDSDAPSCGCFQSPHLRQMPPKSTLMPPRHIVIPTKQGKLPIHFNLDNRKTISQLLSAKWDPSCQ